MFKRRVSQVFRTLPTWPDPKASIGQQIPSSRIGSRKAWWPRGTGPALEAFERNILGEIENALRTLDLTNADLCIKLYMIGRNEDNANPIIMICCLNRDVRSTAKELVRASDILDRYPGFGLGAAALPLECKVPLRRFAGLEATGQNRESSSSASPSTHQAGGLFLPTEKVEGTQQDSNSKFSGAKDVEESELRVNSYRPKIGRRLCAQNLDQGLRFATGGVVVDINEKYYQLTVGHLMKPEFPIQTLPRALSSVDLEECSFDGQSDDDEMDEEVDQQLITSSGSITSNDSRADPESPQQVSTRPGTVDHGALTLSQNSSSQEGSSKTSPLLTPEWFRTSCTIPVKAKQGSLDYMLVSVSFQSLRDMKSDINKISELPLLRIQHIGHMIDQPRIVWVASSSIGLIRGTLSPGAMSYRHHGEEGFQRLLRVQLESPVVEGDCGSAVVDAASGDLYGQIVLGVPGTTFAYIVTATEIFEDIAHSQGDLPVQIVTPESLKAGRHEYSYATQDISGTDNTGLRPSGSTLYTESSFSATSTKTGSSTGATSTASSTLPSYASSILPCEFAGYGCDATFHPDDIASWIDHITAGHMYDKVPPKTVCWFCDAKFFDQADFGDRQTAFESRLCHIREHIIQEALGVHDMRPDFYLLEHMRKHHLIAESAYHLYRRLGVEQRPGGWASEKEREAEKQFHDLHKEERHRRRRRFNRK